jgi:GTP-binding protein LepA
MLLRNFSIIAHVDHGKSTLADRLLEISGTIDPSKIQPQLLDSLDLERERGITIKLAPVRINYQYQGQAYQLNLIDTPGHVDFAYEVSRALAAVEGAILLVDAVQGIQAQTLSHGLAALEQNLVLIPVINKIDLPNADVEMCKKQLIDSFGFLESEIILASGKTGVGVDLILEAIVNRIPSPAQQVDRPLKALIFDSFFDSYKGVVAQVRVVEGVVPELQSEIKFLATGASGQVLEKGYFSPQLTPAKALEAGDIGYIATGIKQSDVVKVGDTIVTNPTTDKLPGYREVKPMVYVGLFPIESGDYFELKEALSKFRLTDPAFTYTPENSTALGAGFRCGFLGLLHAEVVQERLMSEFGVSMLATTPTVEYQLGSEVINNPAQFDQDKLKASNQMLEEPIVKIKIFVLSDYVGSVMELVSDKRGRMENMAHFGNQVELSYMMPLSEMITDFYDKLKSVTSGYGSLDWEFSHYEGVDAVRVDILVSGERVDALSFICYRPKAQNLGRMIVEKLKDVLPRQNFAIAIQAIVGGNIIARETVSPYRKDVTAKLYGGDRTRKDKLLEKQKKGKQKMKMVGKVAIPQQAFLSILKS